MRRESSFFSHGRKAEPFGRNVYELCLRSIDRNSDTISRADNGGTLRVTSGPRCGASLRKICCVETFFVKLASTERTSAPSVTASARFRFTVARSEVNDRKQPS